MKFIYGDPDIERIDRCGVCGDWSLAILPVEDDGVEVD